jgi:toluene monooxygenase electron transfer component
VTLPDPASAVSYRVEIEGTEQHFTQHDGDTLLRAALRQGVGVPYECNAGGCGSCRIQVLDGQVHDLWPEAPGRTDRDRRTGRMLACQTRAASDLTIRVRPSPEYLADHAPVRQGAQIVQIERVTHDMRRLVLRTASRAGFLPGQYLSLFLPGVEAPRNYSMSNLENDDGLWEIIVRRVPGGAATSVMFDRLRVGDALEIDGPYGLATLRPDAERDIVCVAGGSGLAPMLAIARGADAAGLLERRRLHFFYGARTPMDVCGRAELEQLRAFGSSLTFHPVVSTPALEHGLPWNGPTGLVHEAACAQLADHLGELEWYCAGPPPMTQALQRALVLEHRVPVDQIHFDRFF